MARCRFASHPAERETDVVLRDGATLHVRPVAVKTRRRSRAFSARCRSAPRRSGFSALGRDAHAMARLCAAVVAHAMYVRIDEEAVEVAFAIADRLQGHDLGTVLLATLP